MNEKYLVQAILTDGERETVVNSCKTDNPVHALHAFMKLHKNSYKYKYNVMVIETQHVMTYENIFQA